MSSIELVTGCMYCGKTEELLRRVRREMIAGRKVQIFKPNIDQRYSESEVYSHSNVKLKAIPVRNMKDIYHNLDSRTEVVAIDEAQFLDDSFIDFCIDPPNKYQNLSKLIVALLNLDFRGEPFRFQGSDRHVGHLMPYCDITVLKAICTYNENSKICGEDAFYSQRLIDGKPAPYNSPTVQVGSTESYEARCKKHHFIIKPQLL